MKRELLKRFEELIEEKKDLNAKMWKYKDILNNLFYILNESKDNKIDGKILNETEEMYLDI